MGLGIIRAMQPLLGKVSGEVFENYWYRIFGWPDKITRVGFLDTITEFMLPVEVQCFMKFKWYLKFRGWYMRWKAGYIDRHRQRYVNSFPAECKEIKFKLESNV